MINTQLKPDQLRQQLLEADLPVLNPPFVIDSVLHENPLAPEGFKVDDRASANWLVRKICESRTYVLQVQAWAAAEIKAAERDEQFFWFRYGTQLERWASDEVQKLKGRRRSLALPAGTIGFRAVQPKLVIMSEQKLLLWCQRCLPEAIKVTVEAIGSDGQRLVAWQQGNCPNARAVEVVSKSLLNEHFENIGELPDGVDLMNGENRFYVK
jgi:hypothetical protein